MLAWWKSRSHPVKTWIVCWTLAIVVPLSWVGTDDALDHRHAPVDRYSLQASVGNAAFDTAPFDNSGCERESHQWKCGVESDVGSGYSDYYLVAVKPKSSCWTATRAPDKDSLGPDNLHGCVTIVTRTIPRTTTFSSWHS